MRLRFLVITSLAVVETVRIWLPTRATVKHERIGVTPGGNYNGGAGERGNLLPHEGKRILKKATSLGQTVGAAYYFGYWDRSLGVVDIGEQQGKLLEGMGHRIGNRRVLFPEEAFFLIERGLMGCVAEDGALMSIDDARDFFSEFVEVDVMIVYRKAKLQGLHVRRPKGREMAHPIVANSSVGRSVIQS